MIRYAICSSRRSGTSYLCSLLRGAGIGDAREYLNPWHQSHRAGTGLPLLASTPQEFDTLVARAAVNGVFGIKLFPDFPACFDFIRHADCRCFWLRRHDRLRQAISLYRADRTGRWRSYQAGQSDPPFDREAIAEQHRLITEGEARWEAFFATRPHVVMWYEDVCQDPLAALRAVAGLLGVAEPESLPATVLGVQRDEVTEDWVRRYGGP